MKMNEISLRKLLKGVNVLSGSICKNKKIQGIASDSRKIKQGYLFVAIKGEKRNGNDYIEEAIKNGAEIIISDVKSSFEQVILVDDARKALAIIWNNYYKKPSKRMKILAVTGTNGKTSTAYYIYSVLRTSKKRVGLISTVNTIINDKKYENEGGSDVVDIASAMTTPDPEKLYEIIYRMKKENVKYLVLEASSHAIAYKKLCGIKLYVGMFTNLSEEHLDFHKSMAEYFMIKKRLIDECKYKIVNVDDNYGAKIYDEYKKIIAVSKKKKSSFYCEKTAKTDTEYDIFINNKKKCLKIKADIIGDFAIDNMLIAAACCKTLKIKDKYIIEGLESCKIPGRMEKYEDKNIFIDYAHTPLAMECVLNSVKKRFCDKKIVVLFGCGGNRDKYKRKKMGEIASRLCDEIIVTSDNSRMEDPQTIIDEIIEGVSEKDKMLVFINRRDAIFYAVKNLTDEKILILLGKGHEKYEINKNGKFYFDERQVLKEAFSCDKH